MSSSPPAEIAAADNLRTLCESLRGDDLLAAARAIEARRSDEGDAALLAWHGVALDELALTAFAHQAAALARERGLFAFDRLERHFLAPPASWIPAGQDPAAYLVRPGVEALECSEIWPFRYDAPVADYEISASMRWWSHGLVHALFGFGWWEGLSEFDVAAMARLGEAVAALHWYWLAELGREYGPDRGIVDAQRQGVPDDHDSQVLERHAHKREVRLTRLEGEHARTVADNARPFLEFERNAYWLAMRRFELIEPVGDYLDVGLSCDYARAHYPRLTSRAFRRWLTHCMRPGVDYATTPFELDQRFTAVIKDLLTPIEAPSSDEALAGRRAMTVLRDVGERLCHLAALEGQDEGFAGELGAVAAALEKLWADDAPVGADAEGLLGETLARVAEGVEASAGPDRCDALFSLGYRPTRDNALEPARVLRGRVAGLRRRAYAAGKPIGLTVEAMPRTAEIVVQGGEDGIRTTRLVKEIRSAAKAADAEIERGPLEIPDLAPAWAAWLGVLEDMWGEWRSYAPVDDPLRASERVERLWYLRMAHPELPPPERWDDYRVLRNVYLRVLPFSFTAEWLAEFLAQEPGSVKPIKVRITTTPSHLLLGPGREAPAVVPLQGDDHLIWNRAEKGPTIRELLENRRRKLAPELLQSAVDRDLVLIVGVNPHRPLS